MQNTLIEYCYHTHTARCGHAVGLDEEYVKHAIEFGIKRLGFSDHVFIPNLNQPGIRGRYDELEDYLSSIRSLKEKYKDQIEILVGFEAEFSSSLLPYYRSLLDNKTVDYLIMGQHFYYEDGKMGFYFDKNNLVQGLYRYTNDVIEGIKSGVYKYVAHPDFFMNACNQLTGDIGICARRILKACEEYHLPIEVNITGMNKYGYDEKYMYSSSFFFELSKQYDVQIVLGIDAHSPEHFSLENVQKGIDFIRRHNLKLVTDFKI